MKYWFLPKSLIFRELQQVVPLAPENITIAVYSKVHIWYCDDMYLSLKI